MTAWSSFLILGAHLHYTALLDKFWMFFFLCQLKLALGDKALTAGPWAWGLALLQTANAGAAVGTAERRGHSRMMWNIYCSGSPAIFICVPGGLRTELSKSLGCKGNTSKDRDVAYVSSCILYSWESIGLCGGKKGVCAQVCSSTFVFVHVFLQLAKLVMPHPVAALQSKGSRAQAPQENGSVSSPGINKPSQNTEWKRKRMWPLLFVLRCRFGEWQANLSRRWKERLEFSLCRPMGICFQAGPIILGQ